MVFGIPLNFAALLTGMALGVGTRWGVFRYPWVVTKLVLIVTVMLVGGFVLGPASNQMLDDGDDATGRLDRRRDLRRRRPDCGDRIGCVQARSTISTPRGAELMRRYGRFAVRTLAARHSQCEGDPG